MHKVKIHKDVKTIQQKLRHLPLSVRKADAKELEAFIQMGIVERVDASE